MAHWVVGRVGGSGWVVGRSSSGSQVLVPGNLRPKLGHCGPPLENVATTDLVKFLHLILRSELLCICVLGICTLVFRDQLSLK